MSYTVIDDWRSGLDLRRLPSVASPTTLRELTNASINEGGEIEKRLAFVSIADAADTIGLASANGNLYVFGTGAAPFAPGGELTYQQLVPSTGVTLTSILDWALFDGLLFVIARGSDGVAYYFYDGTEVSGANLAGERCRTYGDKVYVVGGKDVGFCVPGDPTDWAGSGSGTINLSTRDADSLDLEGVEAYYDELAFFSPRTTQFWTVAADPANNAQQQVLRGSGTRAGRSVKQYGSGDVLFLDSTGVRSLRARDQNNSAGVSDIGSPVDKLMRAILREDATVFAAAQAAIEEGTGRYWLQLDGECYILSHFPGPKVTAWSKYTPEFEAVDLVAHELSIAVRGDDDMVYLYGGQNYDTYDSCAVSAITPFLSGGKPGTPKDFEALDVAGQNVWTVDHNFVVDDPLSLDVEANWERTGVFDGTTYAQQKMGLEGRSTHVAFRVTSARPGAAVLANLTFHYQEDSR